MDRMRTHWQASADLAALIFDVKETRQGMEGDRASCRILTDNSAVDDGRGVLVLHSNKRPIPSLGRMNNINGRESFKG